MRKIPARGKACAEHIDRIGNSEGGIAQSFQKCRFPRTIEHGQQLGMTKHIAQNTTAANINQPKRKSLGREDSGHLGGFMLEQLRICGNQTEQTAAFQTCQRRRGIFNQSGLERHGQNSFFILLAYSNP